MEALALVPPEILRYVIARSKIGRHIEFDTGEALFEMADEYERLLTRLDEGEITKRMRTRIDTREGALRMSQVERGSDPLETFAGVSFRHLAMLAQIKSTDEEVWLSLRKSNHISGEPSKSIISRLSKMRNWVESEHFPETARISVQTEIDEDTRRDISDDQVSFLKELSMNLSSCEWIENSITDAIRNSIKNSDITGKDAFSGIYLAILGAKHGPRASSLIAEIGREDVLAILSVV